MTTAPDLADLAVIARRLAALLDPCRGSLVPARAHSLDVLARPGARVELAELSAMLARGFDAWVR